MCCLRRTPNCDLGFLPGMSRMASGRNQRIDSEQPTPFEKIWA